MAEFASVIQLSALNGANGFQINGETASDLSGNAVSSAGDVNGDGYDDVIVGARNAAPNGSRSGASYVVFGRASGFAATLELSALDGANGFRLDGEAADDYSGRSVSGAGDVNGDGLDDVIVGAWGADPRGDRSGASHVVFGSADGFGSPLELSALDGDAGFQISGETPGDFSGRAVSGAGDVNGDGIDDVIVGALGADPGGAASGASYVVFGRSGPFAANLELSALNGANGFEIDGVEGNDRSGFSVAGAGDVNGDGFDDVIVGAFLADPNGVDSGASYVVFGKSSGFAAALDLSALNGANGFRLDGEAGLDWSGRSVAVAGDVNGDGFDDVIVGAFHADLNGVDSGASYVVFGKSSGFAAALDLSALNGANGFRIDGAAAGDGSGRAVSGAGDVNGDGFDDVIVGAFYADPNGASSGASYVVFGRAGGFAATLALSTLDGSTGFRIHGEHAGDESGRVSGAGDVNGDGFDDLIVGAYRADPNGSQSGASHVVFGHRAFAAVTRIGTDIGQTINGGTGEDRIDARGGNDTLIGWEGVDTLRGGLGNDVYVLDDVNGSGQVLEFDIAIEAAGAGIDTVRIASLDNRPGIDGYGLRAHVERGVVTGTRAFDLAGNDLANLLTGNGASNALRGLDGNDTLNGGLGSDRLTGGLGVDALIGGAGGDVFDYNAIAESGLGALRDTIAGFAHLIDVIDLSTIDAINGGADDSFVFRGENPFTAPGQVRLAPLGADTIVQMNTIGANGAEAAILLVGIAASTLTAADFVL